MAPSRFYSTSTLLLALLLTFRAQCQQSLAPRAARGHRISTTTVVGGVQRFRQILNIHKDRRRLLQAGQQPQEGAPQRPVPSSSRLPHTQGPGSHEDPPMSWSKRLLQDTTVRETQRGSQSPRLLHSFTPPETPRAPEGQRGFELPGLPDNLRALEVPGALDVPRVPEAPRAPEVPRAPEAPRAPEVPRAPVAPRAPEVPRAPKTPRAPETPRALEVPRASANPESPKPTNRSKASEIPRAPETRLNSQIPRHPEALRNPDAPRVPEVPNHLPADLTNRLNEFPALAEALQTAPGSVSLHSFFEPTIQVEAEELSEEEWQEYLEREWSSDGVVPGLLAAPPPYLANVNYGAHQCLHLGNAITPAHASHKPKAFQFPGEAGQQYVVLLLDLDAPARPYLQWLLLNVPEHHLLQGTEAVQYEAPRPGPGTGQHRLVYLVYRQQKTLPPSTPGLPTARSCQSAGREGVDLAQLTRDLGLHGPLAANYFLSEWDVTVEHTCVDP